ncbi:MAG: CAP domain-containing protein [Dactylosporangium sp.]|nr:CAP domain-containing protein [Dactylosporangium sp.]
MLAVVAGTLVGFGTVFGFSSEPSASAATNPFRHPGRHAVRRPHGSSSGTATANPTGTASPTSAPTSATPSAPASIAALEAEVITLVNAERRTAGCSALAADVALAQAARDHSTDMATRDYFSHETLEGVSFSARITAAGYTWSAAAENIAMGQKEATTVMSSWMNSSGHRANIVNCTYTEIGVGVAANAAGRLYWTQDFAKPR